MPHSRRDVLAAVTGALTLPLAGCTGGGYATGGAGTTGDTNGTTEGADAESEAVVRVRSHPQFGEILTGPEGMTVYMFEQDTQDGSTSACTGGCAEAWPPLTIDSADRDLAGESVTAAVGTVERADGSTQVTVAGWPVYYFESDEEPGDAAGQGVQNVWWVLRPDGSLIRSSQTTPTTSTPTTSTPTTDSDDDMGGGY